MTEERTVYITYLHDDVTADLLEEIFTQVGPVEHVSIVAAASNPRYAFVQFVDEESVPFSIQTMDGLKLFNTPIMVRPRAKTKQDLIFRANKEQSKNNRRHSYDSSRRQSMNDSAPKYVPQNSRRSLNEKNVHIPPRYSQSSAQKRPPPSLLSLPFHTPVKPPLPFNTSAQHMMPSSSLKFQSIPQDPFVNQGYLKPRTLGGYYVQPPKNIPAGQLARSNSLGSGTGNSWR